MIALSKQAVARGYLKDADLRLEVARRLRELREAKFGDLSPEDIIARELEQGHPVTVKARTIRDTESPGCNPTLLTLQNLAKLYDSTIGDLLAFTSSKEDGALVSDLRALIGNSPEVRSALSVLLSKLRLK